MNTKIKSLMKQIDSGQMRTDSAKILNFIIKEKFTSRPMIHDALGIPEKTVTARVSGLLDMGIVEVVETDPLPFGKSDYEIISYQKDPMRQVKNAYELKKAKFEAWKKRGVKEFGEFLNENQLELNLTQ